MVDGVVAPAVGDVVSQSWLNGGNPLGSFCSDGVDVVDTVTLKFGTDTDAWTTQNDHSKWVVTTGRSSDVFCGCDNNRAESQFVRGGLAVCVANAALRSAVYGGVRQKGDCTAPITKTCCHYDDDDTSCHAGDVRLLSGNQTGSRRRGPRRFVSLSCAPRTIHVVAAASMRSSPPRWLPTCFRPACQPVRYTGLLHVGLRRRRHVLLHAGRLPGALRTSSRLRMGLDRRALRRV